MPASSPLQPHAGVALAQDWIDGFNGGDLEKVLSHYRDDVRLTSPVYLDYTRGRTATAQGLGELRDYFGFALRAFPHLRFTLLEVALGHAGLCVRYHTTLGDRIAIECMETDAAGKVFRVLCHYLPNPTGDPAPGRFQLQGEGGDAPSIRNQGVGP